MEEWKLIIGTLAGFITAFLSEPVKVFFTTRSERNCLRQALYKELSYLYYDWQGLIEGVNLKRIPLEQIKENSEIVMRVDCYNYAKTIPILFYSLSEAVSIDRVYNNYQLAKKKIAENPIEGLPYAKAACQVFERFFRDNTLNQKLLSNVSSPSAREMLARLKEVEADH